MKKLSKILLVLLMMFVFTISANAAISLKLDEEDGLPCEREVDNGDGTVSKTCHIAIKVTDRESKINNFKFTFTDFVHIQDFVVDNITIKGEWKYSTIQANREYIFGNSEQNMFSVGEYEVADIKVTYVKEVPVPEEGCYFEFEPTFDTAKKTCYYDESLGIYYGTNGNVVTETEYNSQCNTPTPTYKCQKVGNEYYGKNGNKVTETQFKKECGCRVEDGKYYDENGNETTEEIYNEQCKVPTPVYKCKKVDDKYYDKNGKEVSEKDYVKSCGCHYDENSDKYYDKDGEETTEVVYNQQCVKNICKKVGDKYYDKVGKEVSEKDYIKSCGCHHDKDNDKYYDEDGKEINKEQYLKVCPIENPQTGSLSALLFIIIGIGSLSTYLLVRRYNRLY